MLPGKPRGVPCKIINGARDGIFWALLSGARHGLTRLRQMQFLDDEGGAGAPRADCCLRGEVIENRQVLGPLNPLDSLFYIRFGLTPFSRN